MHSLEIVSYNSADRYSVEFKPGVLYAEIIPYKGVLRWSDPPPVDSKQFLGYYTKEEFQRYHAT